MTHRFHNASNTNEKVKSADVAIVDFHVCGPTVVLVDACEAGLMQPE